MDCAKQRNFALIFISLDKNAVKCYNVLYFWANYAQI